MKLEYTGAARLVRARYGDGTEWQATEAGDWDGALRRTGGRVLGSGGKVLFREEIEYDANDRVVRVFWPHGRAGEEKEGQEYRYDELGGLHL